MKTNLKRSFAGLFAFILVWAGIVMWPAPPAAAQGTFVPVTGFTKTSNIQSNLIKEFPTGYYVTTNSEATPFEIIPGTNGANFNDSGSVSINVFLPAVSDVYTLINAYAPGSGAVATVEFIGNAGADQTFTLIGGTDIRDFYQGSFVNTLSGSITENAFTVLGVTDAGGTGNVNTGLSGNYVVDEQHFALSNSFQSQILTQIKVNGSGNGTPILLGVTARLTRPVISSVTQSGNNLSVQAGYGIGGTTNLVLASPSVSAPLNLWTPIATNILTSNGGFNFVLSNAIKSNIPQEFFVIETE